MQLDEPQKEDVEKCVRTLRLVLDLVNQDPLASGAQAMVEAFYGVSLSNELVHWLRDPKEKVELRNKFIRELVDIFKR